MQRAQRMAGISLAAALVMGLARSPLAQADPASPAPTQAEPRGAESPSNTRAPGLDSSHGIGVVAAVSGLVQVTGAAGSARTVRSGEPLFLGETVTTDASGRLQIMLLDETIFTIGPESSIVIDEFVYDPATDAGTLSAEIARGVFRFITGKIAHKQPEQMKVKLPAGTIGVRGTIVMGRVDGQRSSVALAGPGSLLISNPTANATQQVAITRSGFGTVIDGQAAMPTPPAFVPPDAFNAMVVALGPLPTGMPGTPTQPGQQPVAPQGPGPLPPQGPGGPQGPQPGMPPPPGGMPFGPPPPMMPPPPPGFFQPLPPLPPDPSNTAAQTAANQQQIANGIAKLEQLRSIQTGVFHYKALVPNAFHQTAPVDRFGPMLAHLQIDFGARTVGGGNSRLRVENGLIGPGAINETLPIAAQSFASGDSDAIFTAASGTLSGKFSIGNAGGLVANRMKAEATYSNGPAQGTGVIDNIPRDAGPVP